MDMQNEATLDTGQGIDSIDPWQAAFDALNKEQEESSEGSNDTTRSEVGRDDTKDADGNEGTNGSDGTDDQNDSGELGGQSDTGGEITSPDGSIDTSYQGISEDEIQSINDSIIKQAEESAIKDVAQAFIKRGIRHRNGKLGANIDDPDIMKRDSDGVPTFYNPDTGREFTGDNPRRQAMEWVEDYNKELATAFNQACRQYVDKVVEIEKPRMETLKFAPIYEKLDPVRKSMLDSIIEDYEVQDTDGNVIGYSCDLNKALAAVNRQVSMVQQYAKANQSAQDEDTKQKNNGPALDMKSSNTGVSGEKPEFKSMEEAMEWLQDQEAAKARKK